MARRRAAAEALKPEPVPRRVEPAPPRVETPAAAPPSRPPSPASEPSPVLFSPATLIRDPDLLGGFRIELNLGAPAVAVIAVVLLVALTVAFMSGRSYERGRGPAQPAEVMTPPADVEAAITPRVPEIRSEPPAPVNPAPQPPPEKRPQAEPPPAKAETPTIELRPGMSYLVVQYFPTSRKADAEAAARYLTQNGVPCAIAYGDDLQLIATEAFNLGDKDPGTRKAEQIRADKLQRRVLDLGKAYFKEGRYDFAGARLREIK